MNMKYYYIFVNAIVINSQSSGDGSGSSEGSGIESHVPVSFVSENGTTIICNSDQVVKGQRLIILLSPYSCLFRWKMRRLRSKRNSI